MRAAGGRESRTLAWRSRDPAAHPPPAVCAVDSVNFTAGAAHVQTPGLRPAGVCVAAAQGGGGTEHQRGAFRVLPVAMLADEVTGMQCQPTPCFCQPRYMRWAHRCVEGRGSVRCLCSSTEGMTVSTQQQQSSRASSDGLQWKAKLPVVAVNPNGTLQHSAAGSCSLLPCNAYSVETQSTQPDV